jgi:NADH:ubiquinone oxidoreductase subunit 6 (subunit J)
MPLRNIVFAIVAPLVLAAIIAAIVIGIGETLLHLHEYGNEVYHVGSWPTQEENEFWKERATLFPVFTALAIAMLALVGGTIASALAPHRPPQDTHH